jgi:hypothetical protein
VRVDAETRRLEPACSAARRCSSAKGRNRSGSPPMIASAIGRPSMPRAHARTRACRRQRPTREAGPGAGAGRRRARSRETRSRGPRAGARASPRTARRTRGGRSRRAGTTR